MIAIISIQWMEKAVRKMLVLALLAAAGCGEATVPPRSDPSLEDLRQRLKEPKALDRRTALDQAVLLPVDSLRELLPDIIALLADEDASVRRSAAKSLFVIGPNAKPALESVGKRLTAEPQPEIRLQLVAAIEKLDPDHGDQSLALLALAIRDRDPNVASQAIRSLPGYGANAVMATPALIAVLAGKEQEPRLRACVILAEIGPAAKAALPALITLRDSCKAKSEGADEESREAAELMKNAEYAIRAIENK
jgi:HEAT repeat protein